jgi:hypothetical protein
MLGTKSFINVNFRFWNTKGPFPRSHGVKEVVAGASSALTHFCGSWDPEDNFCRLQ